MMLTNRCRAQLGIKKMMNVKKAIVPTMLEAINSPNEAVTVAPDLLPPGMI